MLDAAVAFYYFANVLVEVVPIVPVVLVPTVPVPVVVVPPMVPTPVVFVPPVLCTGVTIKLIFPAASTLGVTHEIWLISIGKSRSNFGRTALRLSLILVAIGSFAKLMRPRVRTLLIVPKCGFASTFSTLVTIVGGVVAVRH